MLEHLTTVGLPEALAGGEVWTVKDADGTPAPVGTDGARAVRVIDNVPDFHG